MPVKKSFKKSKKKSTKKSLRKHHKGAKPHMYIKVIRFNNECSSGLPCLFGSYAQILHRSASKNVGKQKKSKSYKRKKINV